MKIIYEKAKDQLDDPIRFSGYVKPERFNSEDSVLLPFDYTLFGKSPEEDSICKAMDEVLKKFDRPDKIGIIRCANDAGFPDYECTPFLAIVRHDFKLRGFITRILDVSGIEYPWAIDDEFVEKIQRIAMGGL